MLAPGAKTLAVVHAPGGAHPSPVQGYYNRDHAYFAEYHERSHTPEGFAEWLREQVLDVPDRAAYLERLGAERWQSLAVRTPRWPLRWTTACSDSSPASPPSRGGTYGCQLLATVSHAGE